MILRKGDSHMISTILYEFTLNCNTFLCGFFPGLTRNSILAWLNDIFFNIFFLVRSQNRSQYTERPIIINLTNYFQEEPAMPKKGENIFKRKDGRWEARYIKGYDLSGKVKYGFCYGKTYKEAKEKVQYIKAALLNDAPLPSKTDCHRLNFYMEEWLGLQKAKVKESTYVKYDTMVTKHIIPRLGECFPFAVNTQMVENFKKELLDKGLSAGTVRNILRILHSILNHTSSQFPGQFPKLDVQYPKAARRETRILSSDEQRRLVAHLQEGMDACKFGVLLALLTGLRIGELCALRWKDVSLRYGTIRVAGTMQRLRDTKGEGENKTRVVIGTPKSDMSVRTIPMSESAVELCRKIHPQGPSAFLLTGTSEYMEPRALQYRFKKYTAACGLDGVHFHTLRHTFATRCAEVDFELKSLSEILGHSDTSITLNRYVHSSFDLKRSNMNKLAAVGL